jgi:hypothetical protein
MACGRETTTMSKVFPRCASRTRDPQSPKETGWVGRSTTRLARQREHAHNYPSSRLDDNGEQRAAERAVSYESFMCVRECYIFPPSFFLILYLKSKIFHYTNNHIKITERLQVYIYMYTRIHLAQIEFIYQFMVIKACVAFFSLKKIEVF